MVVDGAVGAVGSEPESSDSLRTFGAVVQALREHAGLNRGEFADLVRFSKHTVASVELGRRMPDPAFVDRAEEALGNTGALRKAAGHLARQPGLAAWFRQWARMEAGAITLYTYECRLIPGLLQTEAYARTLFDGAAAAVAGRADRGAVGRASRSEATAASSGRTPRSASSSKSSCSCGAPAERRSPRNSLGHVLEMAELRNIEIQIMPLVRESHAGLAAPSSCWRRRTPSGTPTTKANAAACSSPTRKRSASSKSGMPGCVHRLSPPKTP